MKIEITPNQINLTFVTENLSDAFDLGRIAWSLDDKARPTIRDGAISMTFSIRSITDSLADYYLPRRL